MASSFLDQFEQRKQDHLHLALHARNQAHGLSGLDAVQLPHQAFPELNFSEVALTTQQLGQTVPTPFLVSSMTAGHKNAPSLNQRLADACIEQQWALGVGSQRRELTDPSAASEWKTLHPFTGKLRLFGNLGLAQLIVTPLEHVQRLVDNLHARAMIIHCNPLQECLQPEGTPQFRGGYHALEQLCQSLSVPVIVKETGCGFAPSTLKRLASTGVAAVDVSGLGGTHWGRIEGQRTKEHSQRSQAADTFKNWGIPTLQCVLSAQSLKLPYEIWGSGGIRSGLDAAKLLALGATTIGLAKPLLEAALEGTETLIKVMQQLEYELKIALFCTGSQQITDLKETFSCP